MNIILGMWQDFIIFARTLEPSSMFWIIPPQSRNLKCYVLSCIFAPIWCGQSKPYSKSIRRFFLTHGYLSRRGWVNYLHSLSLYRAYIHQRKYISSHTEIQIYLSLTLSLSLYIYIYIYIYILNHMSTVTYIHKKCLNKEWNISTTHF